MTREPDEALPASLASNRAAHKVAKAARTWFFADQAWKARNVTTGTNTTQGVFEEDERRKKAYWAKVALAEALDEYDECERRASEAREATG